MERGGDVDAIARSQGARLVPPVSGQTHPRVGEHRFDQRTETVSSMFYGAFIQFAARDPKLGFDKYRLYEDTLEMMAAAIAAPLSRPA